MKVGKASYGGGKKTFKIQDGDNIYRILPPLGKMADTGKWSKYYRVEWGFKDSDGINRPFQDVRVRNFETGEIEVESPAHLQREELKSKKDDAVAALRKDPSNAQLAETVRQLREECMRYNLDSKHYVNAVNLQGEIGLLKIGHKAKLGLDASIKALRESGLDPLSIDKGVYFNFSRSGKGLDTTYTVTPYLQKNNDGSLSYVFHTMDDAFISRLENEAFELMDMYPVVTAEQVQSFIDEGVVAIERVLGRAKSRRENANKKTNSTNNDAINNSSSVSSDISNNNSSLAETKVQQRSEVVAEPPVTNVTETVASSSDNGAAKTEETMSEDEFLKSIGAI